VENSRKGSQRAITVIAKNLLIADLGLSGAAVTH
jgi:hypothetical protein